MRHLLCAGLSMVIWTNGDVADLKRRTSHLSPVSATMQHNSRSVATGKDLLYTVFRFTNLFWLSIDLNGSAVRHGGCTQARTHTHKTVRRRGEPIIPAESHFHFRYNFRRRCRSQWWQQQCSVCVYLCMCVQWLVSRHFLSIFVIWFAFHYYNSLFSSNSFVCTYSAARRARAKRCCKGSRFGMRKMAFSAVISIRKRHIKINLRRFFFATFFSNEISRQFFFIC